MVYSTMRNAIGSLLLVVAPGFAASTERSLPSFFIPNSGLVDPSIRYFVDTPGLQAGFGAAAVIFQVHDQTVRLRFAGANQDAAVEAREPLGAQANFLTGERGNWTTGLPLYGKILYRNLYPGIDMTYSGAGASIKSEFLVAPGADAGRIVLDYSGGVSIASNGDLVVRTDSIEMREEAPAAYQIAARGSRVPVRARYRVWNAHSAVFELGAYDPARPLVIDPTLSYATYLGGSGMGGVQTVAVDSAGSLYAAGWTEALNFPIAGAYQASNAGGVDAFVVKLNAAGTGLLYATYIGGRGDDRAYGIAVDSSGSAYVAGGTTSSNFPLVSPAQPSFGGGKDGFVVKLNATGNLPLYSTYLGGLCSDQANAIAVDSSGNAYVAGDTLSSNFPLSHATQAANGGGNDAFITKLSSTGGILFSTYLGGSADEHAGGIAVDGSGNAYVGGGTFSTNFPVRGPIQAANAGSQDAFAAKISTTGYSVVYATYLGGSGGASGTPEQINAVAVDSSGNLYVVGATNSNNFPVTAGAFQTSANGMQNAFAAKINTAGSALVYSTYLGGSSFDWATDVAIDSSGNAYVAGYTSSPNLPVLGAVQATLNGAYNGFVSELNAPGNGLIFATFYGGSGSDAINSIALDSSGNIYVGGQTSSQNLPLKGALQSVNTGNIVGWLARFGVGTLTGQLPQAISVSPSSGSGNTVTFTAQYSDA